MANFYDRGLQLGSLRSLGPVINKWQELIDDSYWFRNQDAPWWYNERASLSTFAAAVWLCQGKALEEFSTDKIAITERKQTYKGRCDIWFKIKALEFIAEAKQSWPSLGGNMQTAKNMVEKSLRSACRAAGQVPDWDGARLGMVFVVPSLIKSKHKNMEGLRSQFVDELLKIENASIAWIFPQRARNLSFTLYRKDYISPGVILLMRPVRL
jgi:hypothetical protein